MINVSSLHSPFLVNQRGFVMTMVHKQYMYIISPILDSAMCVRSADEGVCPGGVKRVPQVFEEMFKIAGSSLLLLRDPSPPQ